MDLPEVDAGSSSESLIARTIFKSNTFILLILLFYSYLFNAWKNDLVSAQSVRYENCFPSGETWTQNLPVLLIVDVKPSMRGIIEFDGDNNPSSAPMH